MAKTGQKSFSLGNSSQKPLFFAVLMYSLYSHPRYLKFNGIYQQHDPCSQTIFPFLMTMVIQSMDTRAVKRNVFLVITILIKQQPSKILLLEEYLKSEEMVHAKRKI